MASSSSRDRCSSPRQNAMPAIQPGTWSVSASSGAPASSSWRTAGSMSQPSMPATRARAGRPIASAPGERQRLRRPHAMPAAAKSASSIGPSQGGSPATACMAA